MRLHSRLSPAPASDVRFRLASGFEDGPVNHYLHEEPLECLAVSNAVVADVVRERRNDLHRGKLNPGVENDAPLAHEDLKHGR